MFEWTEKPAQEGTVTDMRLLASLCLPRHPAVAINQLLGCRMSMMMGGVGGDPVRGWMVVNICVTVRCESERSLSEEV